MARKVTARRRRLSKKILSGLAFVATSLIGGIISSIGSDLYHTIRNVFLNQAGFPLSFPQIIFLIIGVAGIGLMLSGFKDLEGGSNKPRVRKNNFLEQLLKMREVHGASLIL